MSLSTITWKKKAVGTAVFALVGITGYLGVAHGSTLAQYIDVGPVSVIDGVVASTSANSFTLITNGTSPITVQVTDRTVFAGNSSLEDLDQGELVKVIGRGQGQIVTAQVVQPRGGTGYGSTAGDPAITLSGEVIAKTANSLTIRTETGDVTYQVTDATIVIPGNFNAVKVGNSVLVVGFDNGSGFVASQILRK